MRDRLSECSMRSAYDANGNLEYVGYWKDSPNTVGAPDDTEACFAVMKLAYDTNGNWISTTWTRNSHGDIVFNNTFANRAALVYS